MNSALQSILYGDQGIVLHLAETYLFPLEVETGLLQDMLSYCCFSFRNWLVLDLSIRCQLHIVTLWRLRAVRARTLHFSRFLLGAKFPTKGSFPNHSLRFGSYIQTMCSRM